MNSTSTRTKGLFGVTVGFLLALLLLPTLDTVFRLNPVDRVSENRREVTWPRGPQNFKDVTRWAKDFNDFYSDHFGLRSAYLRLYSWIKVYAFGVPSSDQVLFGKNGRLFLNNMGNVATYRNIVPFTEAELQDFAEKLEERRRWTERRGIQFLYTVTPDAHTIYAEDLPDWANKVNPGSRMDQIFDYLRRHHPQIEFIDLRPALFEAKKMGRVYYTTDSHWNSFGAYVGFREIMKRIHRRYPEVPLARPIEDYDLVPVEQAGGDLASLMGLGEKWREKTDELRPRFSLPSFTLSREDAGPNNYHYTTLTPGLRDFSLVYVGDSFASALTPYLASVFSRVRFAWGYPFDPSEILKYRPKVVLQSVVERSLSWGQGANFPEVQAEGH